MKYLRTLFFISIFASFLSVFAIGQKSEIALTVNEQFVDAALDAVLSKGEPPAVALKAESAPSCREAVTLLRELGGVKSAVRFREGKIIVPLAFRGSYSPPLIGCVDFAGTAEALIEPEFDVQGQRVIAKAKLTNVSLHGSGGFGGSLLARLMQTSIDEKINPVELIRLEKLSFLFPIQTTGALRLNAVGFRYAVQNGSVTFYIPYEFIRS
jgi:hypothetical protein